MASRRRAPEPGRDGLAERRALVLAGVTDEAVLEAAHPMTHPLYRRHNRLSPAEHRAQVGPRSHPIEETHART